MLEGEPVRVLIVDDHAVIREGLRTMMTAAGVHVVGEASTGREAIELARTLNPSMVFMDVRMPDMDGLEACRLLHKENADLPVIIFTSFESPEYLAQAIQAGAAGYLLKGATRDQLLRVIHAVSEGGMLWDRKLMQQAVQEGANNAKAEEANHQVAPVEPLTPRERDILALIAQGMNNKSIGETLFVSTSTVKTHVEHVLKKLQVSDRVQAAVWAIRHGYAQRD